MEKLHPAVLPTIVVRKLGPKWWRLEQDFHNPWQVVPKGFEFDGASVPQALWGFLDPAGEAFEAACVHDYLYVTTLKTKEYADDVFHKMLLRYGVSEHKALVAYRAVRRFGKGNY